MAYHVALTVFVALCSLCKANVFASSSNNVAVYWGQNSYGASSGELSQQPLATYCANTNIDIIPLAFLYSITNGPQLNFANQQDNCTFFPGTQLLNCPDIGRDITTCQEQYNKTIILSIGGATYTEGGFSTPSEAEEWARKLWLMFGPPEQSPYPNKAPTILPRSISPHRPFGNAKINGIDLDFESSMRNTLPFASKLRNIMDSSPNGPYYLTAAPQCPFPDLADDAMLSGGVSFDAVFVQFYNNYCGANSYIQGAEEQGYFNFGIWDEWARNGSVNKNVRVLVGVPGGPTAAGSGFLPLKGVEDVIGYCKRFASFGGVMVWDASQVVAQRGLLEGVRGCLG
ncbi:glycoside hydrolase family 18 protein [Piedraia hortae CBS 480.64]|uniref:chitinase n=1 Tax=Piedraia hortae CBS 480.64 TaxID=1314780 RepID=A0A6A7C7U7_9PEZI|nr:glycoside hydrolase family 18 protein [Piedraia hortae CBS 480.64]